MSAINDFGLFLKHERELRGIPLEEIANATKIHMRFLIALESNNFEVFPGEVFIKGYIRSYAKTISANVETILSAYDECVGKRRLETRQQVYDEQNDRLLRRSALRRYVVLGVLLAGGGIVGLYATGQIPTKTVGDGSLVSAKNELSKSSAMGGADFPLSENTAPDQAAVMQEPGVEPVLATPDQAEGEKESGVEVPASMAVEEKKSSTPKAKAESKKAEIPVSTTGAPADDKISLAQGLPKSEDAEKPAGAPTAADQEKAAGEPMRLRIQSKENAWFNVMVDGSRQVDFILSAGETKSFSGKEFKVTIGNRRGSELALNGRVLALPNSEDNTVRDFQVTQKLLE